MGDLKYFKAHFQAAHCGDRCSFITERMTHYWFREFQCPCRKPVSKKNALCFASWAVLKPNCVFKKTKLNLLDYCWYENCCGWKLWLGPQTYNFGDIKPFFIFSSFLYFHIHIIHKYLSSNKKVHSQLTACTCCRHGSSELCWWCIQRCHMGSPAQWRWCWLVSLTTTVRQSHIYVLIQI